MAQKLLKLNQILVGLLLLVFGLNKFFHFISAGSSHTQAMQDFMIALANTGYIFPIAGVLETLAGLALVFNRMTALLVVLVMPVIVNAFLAHLFLDIAGVYTALVVLISLIIIMIDKKRFYKDIFICESCEIKSK
jgi:putative oxidoreductase